jgi:calpain
MPGKKVYSSGGGQQSMHLGNASQSITGAQTPADAVPHNKEKYAELKAKLLINGSLFVDPDFPAVDTSMFYSPQKIPPIVWKRPKDIVADPKLFVGGASRFDIAQGMLGDCWLLAAVASLCQYKGLLYQVIPEDQTFDHGDYCGAFRFRFWQYGRWEEVVVDDRLPTYNNKLIFLHSAENNEFWSALLEKAYAKLCGSYEALKGGQTSEAMEDFTGGVTETFDLREGKRPKRFFNLMMKATERQSLMCCSIEAKKGEIEAKASNGLIKGHAYTITGVEKVAHGMSTLKLVRIRNPWGNEKEWTGAYSDDSPEWADIDAEEKARIGLNDRDDGEFWMSFEDYVDNFTKIEICMLNPDSSGDSTARKWHMDVKQGTWQKHVTAGGCRNFLATFANNPQFRVKLEDPDDDDKVDNCTIVLGLIQKGRRNLKRVGVQNLTIGFTIYEVGPDAIKFTDNNRLTKQFFEYHKSAAKSQFVNGREVTGRFSLPPGEYVIVPSTYKPNLEGDFIFRIFSEKAHSSQVMDTPTQIEINDRLYTEQENLGFDKKFYSFFEQVAGKDGEIDSFELQKVVNSAFRKELEGKEFSLEACRSMLVMVDVDRNGKLDYFEFRDVWRLVDGWKKQFSSFDTDKSYDLGVNELRKCLDNVGFKLCTPTLSSIALRYANKEGRVGIDDFIQICCRIKASFGSYVSYQGRSFALDDYIMSAIYI